MRYRDRAGATERIRGTGAKIGDSGLKDLAARGRGPRYVIINGRALYTDADIDAWLAQESARPTPKRRRGEAAAPNP